MNSDHLPFLILGAFVLSVFAWREWEFHIKPRRISGEDIKAIVDELIKTHGPDAETFACIEEGAAWRRSNAVVQGKWRRVRKELWRRRRASRLE